METREIYGMTVRITDIIPEHIIGVNDGEYLVLYWEGAEIARIHYPTSLPATTIIERKDTLINAIHK